MNHSIKALFIAGISAVSLNVSASVYEDCITDGNAIVQTTKDKGAEAAQALKQKTTVEQCFAELSKIEAKYEDKTKGVNPSSVMNKEDRAKWAKLFSAIDAKQFKGVPYLQAAYYGKQK